jgi:hypothetical protein
MKDRLLLVHAILLGLASPASGAIRLVPTQYCTIQAAIDDVNDGDVLILALEGVLSGETAIEGSDCVVIRGKRKSSGRSDINKDGRVDMLDFAIFSQNWLQSNNIQN